MRWTTPYYYEERVVVRFPILPRSIEYEVRWFEIVYIKQFYSKLKMGWVDIIIWVFRAYRSRNFSSTYWAAQPNTWIEIHKRELSPECFNEIYPYYKWMQINIPVFNSLAETT